MSREAASPGCGRPPASRVAFRVREFGERARGEDVGTARADLGTFSHEAAIAVNNLYAVAGFTHLESRLVDGSRGVALHGCSASAAGTQAHADVDVVQPEGHPPPGGRVRVWTTAPTREAVLLLPPLKSSNASHLPLLCAS